MLRLFGTANQTKVLVLIGMLEATHPLELVRLAKVSRASVDSFLDRLEEDGVIVSYRQGRNRRVSISPRLRFQEQLVALLKTMGTSNAEILDAVTNLRRRPRKKGKELWPKT